MKIEDTVLLPTDPTDLGRYRLLREIGRGGMSVVHEAVDASDGRRVALKVLSLPYAVTPERRQDLIARFRREARAVALLSHQNIVHIHDVGSDERTDRHFIAMEFLPGASLRAHLERGPLPPAEAVAVLQQVASALDAVHGAGIVHRDVKPSNVMLLPDGSAKLLDFGVARHTDDTAITSTGLIVGSPAYLSPEQAQGGEGTRASDVWALGVLLYEMLAGRPPFTASSVAAVMYQVIHEPSRPVSGLPPALTRVLARAMDKNPARRYPSACALADAAVRALAEENSRAGASAALPRWVWAVASVPLALAFAWGLHAHHLSPPPLSVAPTSVSVAPILPLSARPAPAPTVTSAREARRRGAHQPARTAEVPVPAPASAGTPRPAQYGRKVNGSARRLTSRPKHPISPAVAAWLAKIPSMTRIPASSLRPVKVAAPAKSVRLAKPVRLARPTRTAAHTRTVEHIRNWGPPMRNPARSRPRSRRPTSRRSETDDGSAKRLQKFIWSEGR